MIKKATFITIQTICALIFFLAQSAYSIPPSTPHFFYNNISQHPYCGGYTEEDDDDPIECDGFAAGGLQYYAWGTSYLWTAKNISGRCDGCVEYLMDSTPTLWFNVVDEDSTGEEVWCELEIDPEQQFISPVIRYRSQGLTINSGGSVDWEYTVGQEPYCEDNNCGYYDSGSSSTMLPNYGIAINYYW